ncbi:MAG: Ni/Fe-hydrogenase cytochrome b subunit [Acidobacteriota bacterium]
MVDRKITLKSILWLVIGIWITVSLARFIRGLGSITDLSDSTPWGLWIAFDVMSGVALAAGGFVIAAVVYIFHLEKFRPFVRPAILTALLGYIAVAVGLLYDLGIPLNIWHATIYPQPHSVLFEVAMCVMLYLTVLFLEFCPVLLEHPWFNRLLFRKIHKALKRITIPLVIMGIVLSTLHQSSLGSLFLISPDRVHPLWYSPVLWVLFFVSAVGLGLMTIAAESLFSSWYFGHKLKVDLLSGLGRAASFVLFAYVLLRLADLAVRHKLDQALNGTWQANLFLFEIFLAALLPAILMSFRRIRSSPAGIGISSIMTILGVIGYRFDLCIVAFARPEGISYFPTWMEFAVTIGIVAAATMISVEQSTRLRSSFSPLSLRILMPESRSALRRYSLASIAGAAFAAAALPADVWQGSPMLSTPVTSPMIINGSLTDNSFSSKFTYNINLHPSGSPGGETDTEQFLIIDGNRDGRLVVFPHRFHRDKLGGETSCVLCHHQALPFDQNTSCSECHRDMYLPTDLFNHSVHIARLDENAGCPECHADPTKAKTRENTKSCKKCHQDTILRRSIIPLKEESLEHAEGYMHAMHGLCITCHEQKLTEEPDRYCRNFADCGTCHRGINGKYFRRMYPYAAHKNNLASKRNQAGAILSRPDYEN